MLYTFSVGSCMCETTVSLATYNNQIHTHCVHRKITKNTLKLIARLKQHTREKHTTQPNLRPCQTDRFLVPVAGTSRLVPVNWCV